MFTCCCEPEEQKMSSPWRHNVAIHNGDMTECTPSAYSRESHRGATINGAAKCLPHFFTDSHVNRAEVLGVKSAIVCVETPESTRQLLDVRVQTSTERPHTSNSVKDQFNVRLLIIRGVCLLIPREA